MKIHHPFLLAPALSLAFVVSSLSAGAIVGGPLSNSLPPVDGASASPVNIGFSVNFLGTTYNTLSVNDDGNVTFDSPGGDSDFSVPSLNEAGFPILAPFFADVDPSGSGQVTYGNLTVGGQQAFGVDWTNVGYYYLPSAGTDKLNSFQLLLIQGANPGDFTLEFNYNQIQWEAGLADGGIDGLGGGSAVAGFSSTGDLLGVTYELPGSAVNGALIDGGPDSLVANSINSAIPGSYQFSFVNGSETPEPGTWLMAVAGLMLLLAGLRLKTRRTIR